MEKGEVSVSIREFARLCGKNHSWVRRRIASGTLPANEDGTVPLQRGLEAFKKIVEETVEEAKDKSESAGIETETEVDLRDPVSVAQAFSIAKMQEKKAVAQLKTLELQIKQGNYLPKAEVEKDAAEVGNFVREKLLTIPVRYAGLLENRSQREIEGVLEQAVDEVLNALKKSKFAKNEVE